MGVLWAVFIASRRLADGAYRAKGAHERVRLGGGGGRGRCGASGVITRSGAPNKGGLAFLDLPDVQYQAMINKYLGPNCDIHCATLLGNEDFWKQYNKPFLEDAFKRGDDIRLVSDPDNSLNINKFYERELKAIKGYTEPDGTLVQGLASRFGYIYDASTATYKKN